MIYLNMQCLLEEAEDTKYVALKSPLEVLSNHVSASIPGRATMTEG